MLTIINFLLALLLAPLFPGIINRTKAVFAGRKGVPLLQLYFDIFKLIKKEKIYSSTTSWLTRLFPIVSLFSIIAAMLFFPLGFKSIFSFTGDIILIAYLFGLARFLMVLAALDTGSSFEGMGASREVSFAAFAEPSLFLIFAALAKKTQELSLANIYGTFTITPQAATLILTILVLFILLLVENCRIPIDDPNTHLELTMVHEVMVLDYSSADLAYIYYGSALKIWLFGELLTGIIPIPGTVSWQIRELWHFGFMLILAIIIGIVESLIARIRIHQVFTLLILALSCACFAFLSAMR